MRWTALIALASACVCGPSIPAPDGGPGGSGGGGGGSGGAGGGGGGSGGAGGGGCIGQCVQPACPAGKVLGTNQRFCGEACQPAGCSCFDCTCLDCVDAGVDGGTDAGVDGGTDAGVDGGADAGSCPGGVQCPQPVCTVNSCAAKKRCYSMFLCGPICNTTPFIVDCECGQCVPSGENDEGSPCLATGECSGDGMCRNNVCLRSCNGPGDCAAGQTCDAFAHCQNPPAFGACSYSGGLDHLLIGRREPVTGLCVVVHLAAPMSGQLGINAPGQWGVTTAIASYTDGGCPGGFPGPGGVNATDGGGRVDFDAGSGFMIPGEVAIHVALEFPPDAGVPAIVELNASHLTQCR